MKTLCYVALAVALAIALNACGSGGSDDDSPQVDILVTDAPSDSLAVFSVGVNGISLESQTGDVGPNLLIEPLTVDLIGLRELYQWVARVRVAPGSYVALRLDLDEDAFEVVTKGELRPALNVTDSVWRLPFSEPIVLAAGTYRRLVADVDLQGAIRIVQPSGPWEVSPAGKSFVEREASLPLQTLEGLAVLAVEEAPLGIRIVINENPQTQRGGLPVDFEDAALFLDDDGSTFSDRQDFESNLTQDLTRIQVAGDLREDGTVQSHRAEIVDQTRGRDSRQRTEMEGILLSTNEGGPFSLLIRDVRRAKSHAESVLRRLGNPTSITFTADDRVPIFDRQDQPVERDDLRLGQVLNVRFAIFDEEQRVAAQITLETARPWVEGVVTGTDNLPSGVTVNIRPEEPWVRGGEIESSETPVQVRLESATVSLDLSPPLPVSSAALCVGQTVAIRGDLQGDASNPVISATELLIHPGVVRGTVARVFPGQRSFELEACLTVEIFAEELWPGPIEVRVNQDTLFDGEAMNEGAFFDVFLGLSPDQALEVKVTGFLGETASEIDAYAVSSRSRARLSESTVLWPPNRELVDLCLTEFIDLPKGATLVIDAITQDEPVSGPADGNTSPDAVVLDGTTVSVRAENASEGNGRVYRIAYTVTLDDDTTQSNDITLSVPVSRNDGQAIDDGQLYDSTQRG